MDPELQEIETLIKNKVKSSPKCIDALYKLITSLKKHIRDNIAIADMSESLLEYMSGGDRIWLDRILTELFKSYWYKFDQVMCNNHGDVHAVSEDHYFRLCDDTIYIECDTNHNKNEVTVSSATSNIFNFRYDIFCVPSDCDFTIGRKTKYSCIYEILNNTEKFENFCEFITDTHIWNFIFEDIKKAFPQSHRKSISEHLAEHRALDLQIITKNPNLGEVDRGKLLDACKAFYNSLDEKAVSSGLAGIGIDYSQIKWDIFEEYTYMADGLIEVSYELEKIPDKILSFMYSVNGETVDMRLDTLFIYSGLKQFIIKTFDPDYDLGEYDEEDDDKMLEAYKNKELDLQYPSSIIHYLNHTLPLLMDGTGDTGLQSMLEPVIVPILFRIINYVIYYEVYN